MQRGVGKTECGGAGPIDLRENVRIGLPFHAAPNTTVAAVGSEAAFSSVPWSWSGAE